MPEDLPSGYRRSPKQLAVIWTIAVVIAGLIFWFELTAPYFHELMAPFYVIILMIAVFATWRWLRARSAKDRRGRDRRRAARRGQTHVDEPGRPDEK